MPTTAQEIADRLGLSRPSVSRILSNKPGASHSPETRRRVLEAAREMNYHPNVVARSLAKKRTETIGLMISDLKNPFFVNVLHAFEALVFEAGYQVLLDVNNHDYGEYQPLHKISGWLVDGVLMWTPHYFSLDDYLRQQAANMPVVYLGHLRKDASDACAFDLHGAGRQLTQYLIARGYHRICYLAAMPSEILLADGNHHLPAVADVCREGGVDLEVVVADNRQDINGVPFRIAREIAARPQSARPDAIICYNDQMALTVYQALAGAGLRIPEDIALAGFDGIDQGNYLPHGPLTTVRMPVDVLCRTALDILLRRITGDQEMSQQHVLIPTELVMGATA